MDDLYREHILDHAQQPRNFGSLSPVLVTHVGQAMNASCGDDLSLELQVDENGVIQQIAWKGAGCAISMAAASLLSERAIGQEVEKLRTLEFSELLDALGLSSLAPARIKCATLFLNALMQVEPVSVLGPRVDESGE